MRRNIIGYMGLLGFLGLVGLATRIPEFFGFFGFFGFLSAFWGRGSDERVERNTNRACRNAFVFFTATSAFSVAYIATLRVIEAFPLAFTILFAGSMALFILSYIYYDRRGD